MHTYILAYATNGKTHAPPSGIGPALQPLLPVWDRAQPFQRLAKAYELIHAQGGKVFTLRLHLDALIAVTGSADAARTMSRRVQRAFERAGIPVPHFAFSLEVTPDDRSQLHLHGAIVLGDMDPAAVKTVLRDAAGRITGHAGSRQVQVKNFDLEHGGPAGWARYPQKGAARTRRVIHHQKLTYISQDLRGLARASWEQRRLQRRLH